MTSISSDSTSLNEPEHDELVGEDRDGGPHHHVRHRPGKGSSDD